MDKDALKRELDGKYRNQLDIRGFFQMLKDPAYCYKFYWLEALVRLVSEGKERLTFDEITDEMIANAWYSVVEFRIHLSGTMNGEVRDALERAVWSLKKISNLSSRASKLDIKDALQTYREKICSDKMQLVKMVPYRALSGFFVRTGPERTPPWGASKKIIEFTEWYNRNIGSLPYVFGVGTKLNREIRFHSEWAEMIRDNAVSILGWIQFEKLRWLQNNNIDVPGLVYKLGSPDEGIRKLTCVRNLWDAVLEECRIRDVFKDGYIDRKRYDVDHFVPWSFVMHDEIWNLMPMDSSLNSSKSNKLPRWDPFFKRFAENQHLLYQQILGSSKIENLFIKCRKDNLHAIWAIEDLYIPGKTHNAFIERLEIAIKPIYESAKRQGYEEWAI
ncbi:MAG: hypothetical protein K5657_06645 [Desulfovibrio sp.]|nr:hypothetical protein [Desulfovibrio sp.]